MFYNIILLQTELYFLVTINIYFELKDFKSNKAITGQVLDKTSLVIAMSIFPC